MFSRRITLTAPVWALLGAVAPGPAQAQAVLNSKGPVAKSMSAPVAARLCQPDGRPSLRGLLGELGMNAGINVLALPPPPPLASGPIADTPEAYLASWMIAVDALGQQDAVAKGLNKDDHGKLDELRYDLVDYVWGLEQSSKGSAYALAPGSSLGADPDLRRGSILESLLAPVLGSGRSAGISLVCTPLALKTPDQPKPAAANANKVLVRGKIDDLAVPHFKSDNPTEPTDAFAKASEAKVSFSDNGVKGERTVTGEAVLGYGWQLTPNDAFLGFVHVVQSTTETRAQGDDDDSKDLRAISPGILYRHSVGTPPGRLYATFGATIYPTYDLAQDSRLLRARIFLGDIAIARTSGTPVCGAEVAWRERVYFSCRLGVFAEYGRILDPGRSVDFATPGDDSYAGLGATVAFNFSLIRPEALAPFSLSAEYRYLHLYSGGLGDDPARFVLELAYKIPKSNLSISFSRSIGENSETFQNEDLNKLSIGFKY